MTAGLAGSVWGWSRDGVEGSTREELNLDLADRRLVTSNGPSAHQYAAPYLAASRRLRADADRLDELVPIEPAAMEDRQIIEWDKDDIDLLGFMKVDVLALGMLSCMRRAFEFMEKTRAWLDLATIPEDPATYAMIRKADTLGRLPDREPRADGVHSADGAAHLL
jgi:error-prone DNA polymerase